MDGTKNTVALILNRQLYREHDSLVTAYTPDYGKLSLVARGAQKLGSKLAGHIEPLTMADIMIIPGKGFDYVGSAVSRNVYTSIRQDLNKLYYAGQALQILHQRVKENQADAPLFFLISEWLDILDARTCCRADQGELLLSFFIWRLMAELGYQPELYRCLDCHRPISPGQNYFHLLKGGLICLNCFEAEKGAPDFNGNYLLTISDNCVKILRFIMEKNFLQLEKLRIETKLAKESLKLAKSFQSFHI
ncbi:MAG: DNA repair protein RecO [Patescibacteria group bacterium]